MTATSPVSPDKSIDYAMHALPTAESRIIVKIWIIAFLLTSCASVVKPTAVSRIINPEYLYIVGHGWHTGVVIDTSRVQRAKLAAMADFKGLRYLEIGWGDEGFYLAEDNKITTSLTLRAVFIPTPSVLHIVGFNLPPEKNFPNSNVRKIPVSRAGFAAMISFVDKMFTLSSDKKPIFLGPGLYGQSRFYRAKGSYHFFRTCNTWTQQALQAAGVPVTAYSGAIAESVLEQVDALPDVVRLAN